MWGMSCEGVMSIQSPWRRATRGGRQGASAQKWFFPPNHPTNRGAAVSRVAKQFRMLRVKVDDQEKATLLSVGQKNISLGMLTLLRIGEGATLLPAKGLSVRRHLIFGRGCR